MSILAATSSCFIKVFLPQNWFSLAIYLATILLFITAFYVPLRHSNIIVLSSIGLICLGKIIRDHFQIIISIWEKPSGKFAYALTIPALVTFSKLMTDQMLRDIFQSSPSQFPTAQQVVFIYCFIAAVLTVVFGLIYLVLLFGSALSVLRISKFAQNFFPKADQKFRISGFVGFMTYLYAASFIAIGIISIDTVFGATDENDNRYSLAEELAVISTFIQNKKGRMVERYGAETSISDVLICDNLPPNAYISPLNADVIPTKVLLAEVRQTSLNRNGSRYEFRVVPCWNSYDPASPSKK